jgi:hypothetical protein
MKGSMASPHRVMGEAIGRALYPDLTYAFNSGGDPAVMPDLTWQALRDFHAHHYHPSGARFFTYGDLPLADVLSRIEAAVLADAEPATNGVAVGDQPRFAVPRELRVTCPVGAEEDPSRKGQALVGWLTARVDDSFELLALRVLEQVLLGNAASPLRKALMDAKLGDTLADGTGLIDNYREAAFCAGLKGIDPAHAGRVEAIVLETLDGLVRDGLDRAIIEAAVHQIEIDAREVSHVGAPYGLKVFYTLAGAYLFDGDPYRSLQLDDDLARLPAEPSFYAGLIRRYLTGNSHRARIVLEPDPAQEAREGAAELARLSAIDATLTDADRRAIVERSRTLRAAQETKHDVSVLPTLELADVPMDDAEAPGVIEDVSGALVGYYAQPTNGLSYIDVRADFASLPDRLKDLLPLFAYAVPRSGTASHDYLEMAARIDASTGGIDAQAALRCAAADAARTRQRIVVRGKALARNHGPFADVLRELLAELRFDAGRLRELIAEYRARFEASLVPAGQMYASRLATAKLTEAGRLDERLSGLSQLRTLRELDAMDDLDGVVADMDAIRDHIFRASALQVCVTSEDRYLDELRALIGTIAAAVPAGPAPDSPAKHPDHAAGNEARHEARTAPVPVAFNARVYPTIGYTHPHAPALMVCGNYMRATFLHREIREKGGAYGSHAGAGREEAIFTFWSYRDPHIVRTFEAFEAAVAHVLRDPISPDDLKEAILVSCSTVDPLLSPDSRGRATFFDRLAGYTLEAKMRFKRGLLDVTADDLRTVASAYLTADDAPMAVVGAPEKVAEANDTLGGMLEISPA